MALLMMTLESSFLIVIGKIKQAAGPTKLDLIKARDGIHRTSYDGITAIFRAGLS